MIKIAPASEDTPRILDQVDTQDAVDAHLEELFFLGWTVVENAIDSETVTTAAALLDELEKKQAEDIQAVEQNIGISNKGLIRSPFVKNAVFLRLATTPIVMSIMKRALGEHFTLISQTGIINRPLHTTQKKRMAPGSYHRDLNYQHWITGEDNICMNFLIALDDFTEENGATRVLSSSHLRRPFPSATYCRKHERAMCAPAGSAIIMNGMTFHRTGDNVTESSIRRGINHFIGRPFMAQQISIPDLLHANGLDYSDDSFLNVYLGYRWQPAKSVLAWQQARNTRAY